jgi:uncharacterized protein YcsI (UPF0317 family)
MLFSLATCVAISVSLAGELSVSMRHFKRANVAKVGGATRAYARAHAISCRFRSA